tara:strand:- start:544 stop:753 length:210 start_codon:yes stop_codon:yes gene_type:complete
MTLSKVITRTTTTEHYGALTGDMIRKALGLPDNARVFFDVPGGGDWSNERIDLDDNHRLYVTYTEVMEG